MLTLIAAVDDARGIGKLGGIPWTSPTDMEHFRRTTMNNTVIMGRRTWTSIGRVLPGRRMIVLTRDATFRAPAGVVVVHTLAQALRMVQGFAFVIGGAEIYAVALPLASHMILTHVHGDWDCDTLFPAYDVNDWNLTGYQKLATKDPEPQLTVGTYQRKSNGL